MICSFIFVSIYECILSSYLKGQFDDPSMLCLSHNSGRDIHKTDFYLKFQSISNIAFVRYAQVTPSWKPVLEFWMSALLHNYFYEQINLQDFYFFHTTIKCMAPKGFGVEILTL